MEDIQKDIVYIITKVINYDRINNYYYYYYYYYYYSK